MAKTKTFYLYEIHKIYRRKNAKYVWYFLLLRLLLQFVNAENFRKFLLRPLYLIGGKAVKCYAFLDLEAKTKVMTTINKHVFCVRRYRIFLLCWYVLCLLEQNQIFVFLVKENRNMIYLGFEWTTTWNIIDIFYRLGCYLEHVFTRPIVMRKLHVGFD